MMLTPNKLHFIQRISPIFTAYVLVFLLNVVPNSQEIFTYRPEWITSHYVQAGSANVITTLTGNSSTPTATIPFPGTAFSGLPKLGYGCTAYMGK